jgi:hypothetical protein
MSTDEELAAMRDYEWKVRAAFNVPADECLLAFAERMKAKAFAPGDMIRLETPERSRTYHFGTVAVSVKNVVAVCVRPSGTHRLESADGRKWLVPAGWNLLELDVDEWTF